ncbi:GlcNAc-domain-containing protein [Ochromonadaceae sp. CCMP2298]|nr:GlcNAc-domain-containing protein [Ochromonadaceae sp. CCMP2298]
MLPSIIAYLIMACALVWLVLLVIVLTPDIKVEQVQVSGHVSTFAASVAASAPKIPVRNVTYEKPLASRPPERRGYTGKKYAPIVMHAHTAKAPSQLQWPPLDRDGLIPEGDGYDIMPGNGLKVPHFWYPPAGADWTTWSREEETIFLMIASYRDFQCHETIANAFERADHPERLFVGAVDQTVPGDTGCLDLEIPCSTNPNQIICKYRSQIVVYHMDAQTATGPVTARHIGDRLFRGQTYVMQMDAHCEFVRHWDTQLIQQWRSTGNEMAVLTSYLTDVQGSFTKLHDSTRNTRPIMCNSAYEGVLPARYLRHGSQPEDVPAIKEMPQLETFWAAGFSFSRGHFKLRVPYDAYQPMVFQGEEIAIGIRGFTWGYDFYAPQASVVFHEYASMSKRRKKVHMFWENTGHVGMGAKSLKRATAIIGMAPGIPEDAWDHSEMEKYGLGRVRDVALYYRLFMIDPLKRVATPLCPFVDSGIMHTDFQPYLRKDGMGIDYSFLKDYDTAKDGTGPGPRTREAYWIRKISEALGSKPALDKALHSAQSAGLNPSPSLQQKVDRALARMNKQ